ncbi:MAG: crotonase/enoyl-CoA hydratase family protein [Acidimicrobiia bacterium]
MGSRVTYEAEGPVAIVTMDDGKVNSLSPALLSEVDGALDRAQAEGAVVVLTGREGVFSAGFDLPTLQAGGPGAIAMVRAGFELAHRLLSFPTPVVIACSGHAVAMGLFLVLSGDHRIGVQGAAHKIVANEVAIGLTLPRAAIEICRERVDPAHLSRILTLAETFSPDTAVGTGLLDGVVPPGELLTVARATAERLAGLDLGAHAATKLRVREQVLTRLRAALESDQAGVLPGT